MVVAGASRHAKEIIQILCKQNTTFLLFDDFSSSLDKFFDKYDWVKEIDDEKLKHVGQFVIANGGTILRQTIAQKLINCGLILKSVIAETAVIGNNDMNLANGLNIMNFVFISDCVSIGEGTLVNGFCSIHHDSKIGEYCDISPRVTLLGGAKIGNYTWIGAGATILPNIKIGNNCIIGAGALVNKDIPDNCKAYGVPAKIIHE